MYGRWGLFQHQFSSTHPHYVESEIGVNWVRYSFPKFKHSVSNIDQIFTDVHWGDSALTKNMISAQIGWPVRINPQTGRCCIYWNSLAWLGHTRLFSCQSSRSLPWTCLRRIFHALYWAQQGPQQAGSRFIVAPEITILKTSMYVIAPASPVVASSSVERKRQCCKSSQRTKFFLLT